MPVMVTKKIVGDNIYETQVQTMKRAAAWCNATGKRESRELCAQLPLYGNTAMYIKSV